MPVLHWCSHMVRKQLNKWCTTCLAGICVYKALNNTVGLRSAAGWFQSTYLWTQALLRAVFGQGTGLKNASNRASLLWCVLVVYLLGRSHETNHTFHASDLTRDVSPTHLGLVFQPRTLTTLLARVYYWNRMYRGSCLFADLKRVSDDEECSLKWEEYSTLCRRGLPVCFVWEKYAGLSCKSTPEH